MSHKTNSKFLRIQDSAGFLENIISLLPGHVYWKDRNGALLGCNDQQAKDIGLKSRHDVVGLTAYETLPEDLANAIIQVDNEIMSTGIAKTVQEVLIPPNGKKSIWLSRKIPLFIEDEIIGILGVSLDITEIEHVKEKIEDSEEKLQAMTAVSAGIAHELRKSQLPFDIDFKYCTADFFSKIDKNIRLTQQESNCLNLVLRGMTSKMIGKKMNISPRTAEYHLQNLKSKFNVQSKSELTNKIIDSLLNFKNLC